MKMDQAREQVLEYLQARDNAPAAARELADALGLRRSGIKKIQKVLHRMVRDGDLAKVRGNRYTIAAAADLVTGPLEIARTGNGYINVPGTGHSVFVPKGDTGTALPGDLVLARIDSSAPPRVQRQGGKTAKVIRVVERAGHDIVGTLRYTGNFAYAVPIDPSYAHDFYLVETRGAELNDRVVIRFLQWQNRHVNPEAEVIEVLGPADDPSADTISIIRHYQFPRKFDAEVLREAAAASRLLEQPGEREDLRELLCVTIDPVDARDFDDAVSLTKDAQGRDVVGVHIADVGHFVAAGGAIDREAAVRGNTVYLPDAVIPMLPEQLSNGLCSLKPAELRLAFSVFMTLDAESRVVAYRFARSQIRSAMRLTYEQVQAVLEGKSEGHAPEGQIGKLLVTLNRVAQRMRALRFAGNALDLDVPESKIVLDAEGRMQDVRVVPSDPSHQLIEECMVAANEVVAGELTRRRIPTVYRIHEPPEPPRVEELREELAEMGYRCGDLRRPGALARFLKSIEGDVLAPHVRVAVLRSMNRAVYATTPTGHFGLAKAHYTHFTSPIRRYSDLVVHRQLAALLEGGAELSGVPLVYERDRLNEIANACSQTEQAADEAERSLVELKKLRYLEQQLENGRPEVYEGYVFKVMNFGMFVEIPRLQVQGLVHISNISTNFVRFNRQQRTLAAGRKVYRRGTSVNVLVNRVDFDNRRLDFALA